jgi:hypothetical protein
MTGQMVRAFQAERIAKYEQMRCPKNYCVHREALKWKKGY